MSRFVNVGLLKNPANWLIVFLMVALASMMFQYIAASFNVDTSGT